MFRTSRAERRRRVGLKRLVFFLLAFVLSLLLLVRVDTHAAPRVHSSPVKFAGAFVNWGPVGRERMLQDWEKWLKQPPSSVLGVDFYGQTNWDDFHKLDWVPGLWKKLNSSRNVVWSVPLTITGTPLADVASGLHDAEFEAAARAISAAQPKAIIRLGWEMNLSQMGWFSKDHEADYIAAFRRVVGISAATPANSDSTGARAGARRKRRQIFPIPATMWSITSASTSTTSLMKVLRKSAGTRII